MSQNSSKIVVACENADANTLVQTVGAALNEKLVNSIDTMKKTIAKNLFENCQKEDLGFTDTYESLDAGLQEAVDYVTETVLESGLALEQAVHMSAKQFNVNANALQAYFERLTANHPEAHVIPVSYSEATVDSTSSDDHDEKGGVRDDMDTNKRVRYETKK